MSKHEVSIVEGGIVEIHRLEADGSRNLFTRIDGRAFDFPTLTRLLGENLLMDSAEARDLFDL